MQDLFHSTTYWLKACGIFKRFLDKYMEAEPYIPLPKENVNQPLVFDQLMMLWIIWGSGLTAGLFAFVGEHVARKIAGKSLAVADSPHTQQHFNKVMLPIEELEHH